jgi:EamA domain-containing membrane protein RarD
MNSFDYVSVLAITLPFVMVIFVVGFAIYEKIRKQQIQADLYAKALEKGQPIPADLFADDKRKRNPLNTGIICMAAGIGTALFFWLTAGAGDRLEVAALGIIPFLIGVAYLIIHFIEKKQQ